MDEAIAGIIGAVAGAALTGGIDALRGRGQRRREDALRNETVYLEYLAQARDAVQTRSEQHEIEQELTALTAENEEASRLSEEADSETGELRARARELMTAMNDLRANLEAPGAREEATRLGEEVAQLEARIAEGGGDVDTAATDSRLDRIARLSERIEVLKESAADRTRSAFAARDRLALATDEAMLDAIEGLHEALDAYQQSPHESTYQRYQQAEIAYLLAVPKTRG